MARKLTLALIGGLIAASIFGGVASAHVHGVTPLKQISVDNPNSGGNGTNGTPADDANGGPIAGLIPATVGSAPLVPGPIADEDDLTGGWMATGDNAP